LLPPLHGRRRVLMPPTVQPTQSHKNQKRQFDNFDFCDFRRSDVLPEPNFPARPDEFVGRRQHIEAFRYALQQGLAAGRTSSFAILGDWGIGKSSLLLKFAAVCSEHTAANFSSKLLLPIPQSPRMANELVRPAANPCCKAYRNASMCCLRPTNSSGLAGKFGSGSTSDLRKSQKSKLSN